MDDDVDVVGDALPGGGADLDEAAALAALDALFGDGDDVEDEGGLRRRMRAAARANKPGEDSRRTEWFLFSKGGRHEPANACPTDSCHI